jgi:hypothetical protein
VNGAGAPGRFTSGAVRLPGDPPSCSRACHIAVISRRTALLAVLAALALVVSAGALASNPASEASAVVVPAKLGAKNVTLTVSLRTELRCGRLAGTKALVLALPARAHVPSAIPASAVLIGGRAAGKVGVAGHTLTVAPAPPRGVMCDSIRVGVVKIVVLPAAGLGNPRLPGAYVLRLTYGPGIFPLPVRLR